MPYGASPFGTGQYPFNPYLPITNQGQQVQPYPQPQITKVDGADEAMSRLIIKYGNQLVPGFVSEPVFDVNGTQFHTLSVEPDGRRNLETFDFQPHIAPPPAPPSEGVSRAEFDALAAKVDELIGGDHGVQGPVPAGGEGAEGAV